MKRTVVTAVPVLALAGLSLGLGAQPAAADVLPAPTTLLSGVTGLLPSASPLPLPLPTTSALPLPLPTTSSLPLPLPLPTSSPAPLPLPLPTTSSLPLPLPTSSLGVLPGRVPSGRGPVRTSSAGDAAVPPGTLPDSGEALTGSTPGVQLMSASAPAWASALTGTTAFPSLPKALARPVALPAPLTATRAAGAGGPGLPAPLVAAAVLVLAAAAGGQVLVRTGRL